jgi:transposase InsO family protein
VTDPAASRAPDLVRRQFTAARPDQLWVADFTYVTLACGFGTVGDAYDNALAETTIGLYKTECARDGSPFRAGPLTTLADLEGATSAWVH